MFDISKELSTTQDGSVLLLVRFLFASSLRKNYLNFLYFLKNKSYE
jgi:hypothetical protein